MKTPFPSIYIHVPFCRGKCRYCDFFSVGMGAGMAADYVKALAAEMRLRRNEIRPEGADLSPADGARLTPVPSIYIGGGTPSLLPETEVNAMGRALREAGIDTDSNRETTVEMNPDDVSPGMAAAWREAGANRVSMGVQSFCDSELRNIGRRHTARRADEAFATLRSYFDNISIDLIYGLPGQTRESWRSSVAHALSLRPEHISAYSLMYEPGTPLTRMRDAGQIVPTADSDVLAMMDYLCEATAAAGYEQYEISNFALPGRRSLHNSSYWEGASYVGFGPGAHSFDGLRTRRANPPQLRAYLSNYLSATPALFAEEEELSDKELLEELIFTRLRTRRGISLLQVTQRFGDTAANTLRDAAQRYVATSHLNIIDSHISLTRKGIAIANLIELDLMPD